MADFKILYNLFEIICFKKWHHNIIMYSTVLKIDIYLDIC